MKQKKENRVALLLHWAGEQKIWLFLAIFLSAVSGLCIIVPYIGIYRLMDATFNHTCTQELVVHTVVMIAVAVTLRFALFGCSGVAAHKGAYGALFKVRCMVAEHMARAPLGALNERRTGDIKIDRLLFATIGRTFERNGRTSLEPIACCSIRAYCIR